MWIGCVPGWATSNSAVMGEEDLALPACSSPPRESVWVLDAVLDPSSPVRGEFGNPAAKTKMTLRATYTIPTEYVTSTTTDEQAPIPFDVRYGSEPEPQGR